MNNNRNSGGSYPPNREQNYTYNSNQTKQYSNGTGQNSYRNQTAQNQSSSQRPTRSNPSVHRHRSQGQARQYPPRGNSGGGQRLQAQSANMKQPISWIPLFAALLVLMISVGVFCTVLNSRSRTANAGEDDNTDNSAGNLLNPDGNDENGEEEASDGGKITVAYASSNAATAELGDSIKSDYAILIDLESNTVTAQKNPDATIFPASMTKIMTLIVAYENCKDLDDTFTITNEITDPLYRANATVAGFSAGEEVTIRDLLYGAILPSGADATEALAIYTAGSAENFVEIMNRKVLQMGLSNTHFVNTSGLHEDDHYTTPHEIALILEYALQIEECREILCTYQYTTEPTSQHPQGLLLTSTMFSRMAGDESGVAEVLGGKTGYTNEGLHCLASYAKVEGEGEYILVTAHAPSTYDPVNDCINIYKNLFGEE